MSKLITREGAAGNGRAAAYDHEVWGDRIPFKFVKDDKVVVGKDDWLFLNNDSNGFLRQYAGELKLSENQLEQWQELLETRIARVAELGASYHFIVAPENPTVYPEMLPDDIKGGDERTVQQLMRRLSAAGSRAKVIYPLDDLLDEKLRRRVCRKTDTHWTDFGAFAGYQRLVRELELELDVPFHEVSEEELWFFQIDQLGDLGYKLGVGAVPEQCTGYLYSRATGVYDNCVESHGSIVVTECAHAPPTKCMVFGDSACFGMLACLAQTFGRLMFIHSPTLDYDLIREESPDVVVSEMTERFLIMVPDDSAAEPVRALVAEKTAKERLRPRVLNWDPSPEMPAEIQAPSIETIETARAHLLSLGRQEGAIFVSLMAYAGLSAAEALRLSWRQVAGHTLIVESGWTAGESSGAMQPTRRVVPLLEPLADDLAAWRAASGSLERGYVLPGLRNRDWDDWSRRDYRRAIKQTGQPSLGPGIISGGFAALTIDDGASPSEIARLMGISRDDVARRYWYLLEGTVPNQNALPAAERIRQIRAASNSRTHRRSFPGAALVTDLWHSLLPHTGPRTAWEDSLGVRPISVETVERIRARLLARGHHEEATFVSVMAYAGLSQGEALPLKWRQLENGALEIGLAHVAPGSEAAKTLRERRVPLLEILAEDLEAWRVACGSPELGLIFPNLRKRNWQEWVRSHYHRAAKPAGRGRRRPHYLCHTFSSLLISEGRSLDEVARQTGLSCEEAVTQYAHLFDEARVRGPVSAPARILDARAALRRRRGFGFLRMLERLKRLPSAGDIHATPPPRSDAAGQEDS